jgi:hypothetical protein
MNKSRIVPLVVVLVVATGCAGVISKQYSREATGTPTILLGQLRTAFENYHMAAYTQSDYVQTRVFDPDEIWNQAQVAERVECQVPKKPKATASAHVMTLSVRAHVQPQRGAPQRVSEVTTAFPGAARVYLSSSGSRGDGAHCSLTPEFANALLSAATGLAPINDQRATN